MKNITMIAAIGKNNELGKNNNLIWHLKEDLQFFKEQTMGKPVIMGINTFYSLPKMLPGRTHLVLTTKNPKLDSKVIIIHSKEELLKYIEEYNNEVMVIGGATVYREMLEYADKLILTEIEESCKEADAFFPIFDKNDYNREELCSHEENNIKYKHLVYTKKSNINF